MLRDGEHDFDFFVGTWKVHNWRLKSPLAQSTEAYGFEGLSIAQSVWDSGANFDVIRLAAPTGQIDGLTVRLYDFERRLWSLYWANRRGGLSLPPTVGSFDDHGVGLFYADELFSGRRIVVRYKWTVANPRQCRWEQAFSEDSGRSWEDNWIMDFFKE